MMSTGYLLLLSSLCCWLVGATNPGLKIRLSQPGLNYAARLAVQKLSAKVRGASLPDQRGQSHTPVGKVEYEVKNIRVCGEFQHRFNPLTPAIAWAQLDKASPARPG